MLASAANSRARNSLSTETNPETALVKSFASDALGDVLADAGDAIVAVIADSTALDSVPIIGLLKGSFDAYRDIRDRLFVRKVLVFLREIHKTSNDERTKFLKELDATNATFRFGEAILLLLERADSMQKPEIVGRVMAAHVAGHISYQRAARLAAIVDRCYVEDFRLLTAFRNGTQGANTHIAESLAAAGLLSNAGIDGGSASGDEGGVIYHLNEYGRLLVQHGLSPNQVPKL